MESERILLPRRWALGTMLVSAVMPQLAFGQAAQDAASNQRESVMKIQIEFNGQTMTVLPGKTPCYRCIFPEPPESDEVATACSRAGVMGVLPGVIGTIQTTEAIKFLLGIGDLLTGRLLTYNALALKFREIPIKKKTSCPACG